MKRIKTFLRATMTDTGLISLAFIHIHRDFRVDINFVVDSFNEKDKQENQTDLNSNTLTLNNFDMPITLFRIPKCNRLGTPPGVLSWAHGCVFVCSRCTTKNISFSLLTRNAHRTLDECVRRSKCNPDAWNVHLLDFCKCRHVLYYVFPVISAVHRRILIFFFAHPGHTENTSMY